MTTFQDREKEFEARFKHDEELKFKVTARRNRLLGEWAAARMGLTGEAADAYAREVVEAEFKGGAARPAFGGVGRGVPAVAHATAVVRGVGFHISPRASIVLRMTTSLRMQATSATLVFLP